MEPMEMAGSRANTDLTNEELFEKYKDLVNQQLNHVVHWKTGFRIGVDYEKMTLDLKAITAEVTAIEELLPALVVAEYNLELIESRPDLFK